MACGWAVAAASRSPLDSLMNAWHIDVPVSLADDSNAATLMDVAPFSTTSDSRSPTALHWSGSLPASLRDTWRRNWPSRTAGLMDLFHPHECRNNLRHRMPVESLDIPADSAAWLRDDRGGIHHFWTLVAHRGGPPAAISPLSGETVSAGVKAWSENHIDLVWTPVVDAAQEQFRARGLHDELDQPLFSELFRYFDDLTADAVSPPLNALPKALWPSGQVSDVPLAFRHPTWARYDGAFALTAHSKDADRRRRIRMLLSHAVHAASSLSIATQLLGSSSDHPSAEQLQSVALSDVKSATANFERLYGGGLPQDHVDWSCDLALYGNQAIVNVSLLVAEREQGTPRRSHRQTDRRAEIAAEVLKYDVATNVTSAPVIAALSDYIRPLCMTAAVVPTSTLSSDAHVKGGDTSRLYCAVGANQSTVGPLAGTSCMGRPVGYFRSMSRAMIATVRRALSMFEEHWLESILGVAQVCPLASTSLLSVETVRTVTLASSDDDVRVNRNSNRQRDPVLLGAISQVDVLVELPTWADDARVAAAVRIELFTGLHTGASSLMTVRVVPETLAAQRGGALGSQGAWRVPLRILSFNIWNTNGPWHSHRAPALARLIALEDVDVVTLQEVRMHNYFRELEPLDDPLSPDAATFARRRKALARWRQLILDGKAHVASLAPGTPVVLSGPPHFGFDRSFANLTEDDHAFETVYHSPSQVEHLLRLLRRVSRLDREESVGSLVGHQVWGVEYTPAMGYSKKSYENSQLRTERHLQDVEGPAILVRHRWAEETVTWSDGSTGPASSTGDRPHWRVVRRFTLPLSRQRAAGSGDDHARRVLCVTLETFIDDAANDGEIGVSLVIDVCTVHFSLSSRDRLRNAKETLAGLDHTHAMRGSGDRRTDDAALLTNFDASAATPRSGAQVRHLQILSGDFNAEPEDESVVWLKQEGQFVDAFDAAGCGRTAAPSLNVVVDDGAIRQGRSLPIPAPTGCVFPSCLSDVGASRLRTGNEKTASRYDPCDVGFPSAATFADGCGDQQETCAQVERRNHSTPCYWHDSEAEDRDVARRRGYTFNNAHAEDAVATGEATPVTSPQPLAKRIDYIMYRERAPHRSCDTKRSDRRISAMRLAHVGRRCSSSQLGLTTSPLIGVDDSFPLSDHVGLLLDLDITFNEQTARP